jgi:hypothetical protein
MIIAMAISMSGGRDDDRPWPGVGVPFEVTDEEGAGLVRWGHAVDLGKQFKLDELPPNLRLPGTPHVTAPAPVSLPAQTAAGPADNPPPDEPDPPLPHDLPGTRPEDPDPEPGLAADELPEPPKPSDPKQAWVDYAAAGAPPAERIPRDQAEGMTKVDLMSRYGGRL